MAKNQVTLTFAGDADKLNKVIGNVESRVSKMNRNLTGGSQKFAGAIGKVAKGAAVLGGAGIVALGGFGLKAIEAGEALNSIRSQTEAVVKSTKGIANVSAGHIKEYSQELSNLAAVDRKVIESSQNVLLTFTNVRNEVGKGNKIFDQASLAALNMSAALGQDLQSSTVMVGKALNDPIKGITAMSRAGVQFTEQQKDQIKTMTEAGDILGAQKIILGELETQFAGSAAANADSSDKIKLAFGRITEEIGLKLLPYLDRFATWLLETGIPSAEKFAGWIGDEVVPELQKFAKWVGDEVVPKLEKLGGFVNDTIIPGLAALVGFFKGNTDALKALAIAVGVLLVPAFIAWAVGAATAAAATIAATFPILAIAAVVGVVAYLIIKHWDKIKATFKRGWDFVKSTARSAGNGLMSIFRTVVSGIGRIFGTVTSAITAPFRNAFQGVRNAWNSTIGGKGVSIPSWVPKYGGKSFRIPRLAQGGVLRAKPGGHLVNVAEAGRDEAVIPLDRLGKMVNSGSSVIELRPDGTKMSRLLLEVLREAIGDRGGNVQVVLGR